MGGELGLLGGGDGLRLGWGRWRGGLVGLGEGAREGAGGVGGQQGPLHSGLCCLSLLLFSWLHFRCSQLLQPVHNTDMQRPSFLSQTEQK